MFDSLGRLVYTLMMHFNNIMGGNPVLTVVVFTILLRIVMSPFDVISRKAMQKQTAAQPYIAKIQKRYAGNPQVMQKKLSEFNKKHGISMVKGCLPLLLTWPLFIVFLDAMNYWGYVSNINIFLQAQAGNYDITANSWLWINNIWSADSGLAPVVLSAEKFAAIPFAKLASFFDAATLETVKNAAANGGEIYTKVMAPVAAQYAGVANGWFILPLISGASVILQTYVMQGRKKKDEKGNPVPNQPGTGMGMSIFMAVFSAWICLSYNSMFSMYWLVSNAFAILLQLVLKKIYPASSYVFEGEAELQ